MNGSTGIGIDIEGVWKSFLGIDLPTSKGPQIPGNYCSVKVCSFEVQSIEGSNALEGRFGYLCLTLNLKMQRIFDVFIILIIAWSWKHDQS